MPGEHCRGQKDKSDASEADLPPSLAHKRGDCDQYAAKPEEYLVRTRLRLQDGLELVDHIRAHVGVRPEHASDLEKHVGESDWDENENHVPEHLQVPKPDDDRYRDSCKKQYLVVRETETEHESGKPENLVGRLFHPTVGEEKHPHEEEGVERVDFHDCGLRPHDR